MKLAVPDLISNSYFPAIAAVELGFFAREGLDVSLELVVPVEDAMAAMRDGTLEFIGCSAHLLVGGFRNGAAPSSSARRRRACIGSW